MIERPKLKEQLRTALKRSRIVAVVGPRQCGKTTLARQFVDIDSPNYFDLEDPTALALLEEPMTALADLRGIVVIDEVQRRPDLFPVLRVLADRTRVPARFLILGSASPSLLRQTSESLAGRIEVVTMAGFFLGDIGVAHQKKHWLRGGFPLSFLSRSEETSISWRRNFVQTFLERDIPQFGFQIPATTLLRFWTIVAQYHGQIWNSAEPARTLGVSEPTIRRYLDLLTDLFMIRQLQPWYSNIKKRQVKTPKTYFRDTGLLHQLLGIRTHNELLRHPKCGSSWEGYVVEECITTLQPDEVFFWATHNGAEIDLVMHKRGQRLGVECKRTDAPRLTPSIRTAIEDINLDRVAVIYPGKRRYSLGPRVEAVPFEAIVNGMKGLFP
ncbi:MAG: ATP-binding protein [Ignavibacteriae bacterium]|nr:ATP-binding protein [Ignavibacteriota bacterium]